MGNKIMGIPQNIFYVPQNNNNKKP